MQAQLTAVNTSTDQLYDVRHVSTRERTCHSLLPPPTPIHSSCSNPPVTPAVTQVSSPHLAPLHLPQPGRAAGSQLVLIGRHLQHHEAEGRIAEAAPHRPTPLQKKTKITFLERERERERGVSTLPPITLHLSPAQPLPLPASSAAPHEPLSMSPL